MNNTSVENKSKILFYTGASTSTSTNAANWRRHLAILKSIGFDVDMLSNNKTNSDITFFNNEMGLDINFSLHLLYEQYISHQYTSWYDVYEKIDVSSLQHYSKLFIIGSYVQHTSHFFRNSRRCNVFPFDSGQLKFMSAASRIFNILVMLKAHNEYKIPLHEYNFDTTEMSCDLFQTIYPKYEYYKYYGYGIPQYDTNRLDSHQYYLLNHSIKPNLDKNINFIGGYTTYMKSHNRDTLYKNELYGFANNFTDSEIYIKSDRVGVNNRYLSWNEYNERLSRTRYTMVFPAYDTNVISIDRLIGAVWNNCLPIFHSSCKLDIVEKSFDVDLKQLITIQPFKEDKRLELLEELNKKILVFEHSFK